MWQYQELKLPFDGDSATALNFEQYPLKNDFGFMLKYSPNGWDHYLIFNNDIENATALETRYMSAVYGGPLKMCAINSWKEINQLEARSTNEYYAPLAAINTDSLFPAFQAKFPIPENLEKRYNNTYHSRKKAVFTEEYMIFNDSVLVNKQLFYDFVYTKLTPKQKELICYPIAADLTRDGQDEFFQFAISNGKLLDWWVYKFDEKGTRKMSKHQAKRLIKRTVIYNNMKYASKMGVLEKTVE
jgi:hypothetical protein